MSARDELATPPDFFQPGRTYADSDHRTDWRFRCDSVTTHPDHGDRTALGWRHFRGEWEPYAYAEDDWDIHQHVGLVDVTGDGEVAARGVDADRLYRDAYATGRDDAGALGWRLNAFTPVFTRSDGTDKPVSELRCTCGTLLQHVGEASLLDLAAMAARHDCQDGAR